MDGQNTQMMGAGKAIAQPMTPEQEQAVMQNERTGMELQRLRAEHDQASAAVVHLNSALDAAVCRRNVLGAAVEQAEREQQDTPPAPPIPGAVG